VAADFLADLDDGRKRQWMETGLAR